MRVLLAREGPVLGVAMLAGVPGVAGVGGGADGGAWLMLNWCSGARTARGELPHRSRWSNEGEAGERGSMLEAADSLRGVSTEEARLLLPDSGSPDSASTSDREELSPLCRSWVAAGGSWLP